MVNLPKTKSLILNRGMTYIELIVVLSIFSIMTSVVLFSYDKFQAKVDIKNLANDIALKIVEAQKSASSGRLPPSAQVLPPSSWKPSYGVYFNLGSTGNNKNFVYFIDLNQNGYSDSSFCSSFGGSYECVDKINITKNNYISSLNVFYTDGSINSVQNLAFTFTRPNLETAMYNNNVLLPGVSYVQITITSPAEITANIRVYPSGRIQIN